MRDKSRSIAFKSPLGKYIEDLIAEKRALGYKYDSNAGSYKGFDRFLAQAGLAEVRLPKELVLRWMEKRPNETRTNHVGRIYAARKIGLYLASRGLDAYVPDSRLIPRSTKTFRPRILTRDEVRRVLEAADSLPPSSKSPLFHIAMPLIYRILYGCGLRASEALNLRIQDVDRQKGVLTIRQAKFMRDRLVPLDPGLWRKVERHILAHRSNAGTDDFLFPSPRGGRYTTGRINKVWRELLYMGGIAYEGKGKGPRLHDLRHTYAVHRLASWYAAGEDLSVLLPVLSAYMGHARMKGTQHYLHLAAEMYPEVTSRLQRDHGYAIPGRTQP